jgi:hypothetical protein
MGAMRPSLITGRALTRRAGLARAAGWVAAAGWPAAWVAATGRPAAWMAAAGWPAAWAAPVAAAAGLPASGRTWPVGPGTGQTLAQALRRAGPGDTVEVRGTLQGEVGVIEQPGLTLRGAVPGAALHAAGRSAEGKAILVVRAPGVRIEQLGFAGCRVRDGNGAGIRLEDGSLAVTDCRFTDNEMGLLTSNAPTVSLALRACRFTDAPRHDGPLHHLVYAGRIARLTMHGCTVGQGFRGHLVKSRARLAVLVGNRLDDTLGGTARGAAAYELELAEGGRALVAGNVIIQSPDTRNDALLSLGAEAVPDALPTEVWLLHNTFVQASGPGLPPVRPARFIHAWPQRLGPGAALHALNNLFVGPGTAGLPPGTEAAGNWTSPATSGTPSAASPANTIARRALSGWQPAPGPQAPAWWPAEALGPWPGAEPGIWAAPDAPGALAAR